MKHWTVDIDIDEHTDSRYHEGRGEAARRPGRRARGRRVVTQPA
jgi:hypothetical protein